MTEEQFKMLRAIQFAQLALLQSIDANIRSMALQEKPKAAASLDWRQARTLIEAIKSGNMGRRTTAQ
jgi:hypothetical protein